MKKALNNNAVDEIATFNHTQADFFLQPRVEEERKEEQPKHYRTKLKARETKIISLNIRLTQKQKDKLIEASKSHNISQADIICQLIDNNL